MVTRYSHPPEDGRPGVELTDHLSDVAARVDHVVSEDATTPAGDSVRDVVRALAYVHDLGKATTFFQQYIGEAAGTPPSDRHRHHAPLGSFAAYHALDAQGYDTETCLAGFIAVAKHHGRLPDVAEYIHERTYRRKGVSGPDQNDAEKRQTVIFQQILDIDEHAPDLAHEVIDDAVDGASDWRAFHDEFRDLLGEIASTVGTSGRTPGINRESLSESCYGLVLELWGALVLADKTSAAGTPSSEETYAADVPSAERLAAYIDRIESDVCADPNGSRTERLNHYRSRARETVLDNVTAFADESGGVATLTLPTGMGKTLTGLSAAFALRDRLDGERVVYALPFTSVIDQVVDELGEIYQTDSGSRLLTTHHHLSETAIRDQPDDDEADLSDDTAAMLAESWRSGLTVSTFVQLFESLAGPGNRQSMKIPALRDSVIVLDEPQSLPLDWWHLVPRLVRLLTEQYGATVIAMTATQPQLFRSSTELVDDPDAYFEAATRVAYDLDVSAERYLSTREGPKSYVDAATELRTAFDARESALAVCNTIDSARELTDHLMSSSPAAVDVAEAYADVLSDEGNADAVDPTAVADRVEEMGDRSVLHLSTRLRPVDRLKLIETAKELTERGHGFVVVSTQLVEAGVDISFARVYRDLAPVDSIVQAAGRCNRSFERDRGQVTVWWLDGLGDQSKTPAEAVYNSNVSLLSVAAQTLKSVREDEGALTETAVARTAVKRYYRRLREDRNVGKLEYATYVDDARADELGNLSLIDQRQSVEILVCRTDAERALVGSLRDAQREYDFQRLRRLLDETKPLRISIPIYPHDDETRDAIEGLPRLVEDEGIYALDVRQYGTYYDRTTGFVVPNSTAEARLL